MSGTIAILIASLILLASAEVRASTPVKTRKLESFSKEVSSSIEANWKNEKLWGQNPDECKIFQEYTLGILRRLIVSSNLQQEAKDLYFYFDCYNLSQFPWDAKLRSRTLELNQGYFGSLKTEDEWAALLAHELSHHILRHEDILEPYRSQVQPKPSDDLFSVAKPSEVDLRIMNLIKINEDEAELNSISVLANAGYSYLGALTLLEKVEATQRYGSMTHSSFADRRKMIESGAAILNLKPLAQTPYSQELQNTIDRYFSLDKHESYDRSDHRIKVIEAL